MIQAYHTASDGYHDTFHEFWCVEHEAFAVHNDEASSANTAWVLDSGATHHSPLTCQILSFILNIKEQIKSCWKWLR